MAFSLSKSFLFISVLLAFLQFTDLTNGRPSVEATATATATANDLIGQVCSKARNPTLCAQALKSDRRSAGADLKGLGLIAIDVAQASAKSTANLVKVLRKGAKKPRLIANYDTCSENFDDSVSDLDDARASLKAGDIGSLSSHASAAETNAETCSDTFAEDPSTPLPSQLGQAIKKLEDLCNVALVIASSLSPK